jgi:hypothetical protein
MSETTAYSANYTSMQNEPNTASICAAGVVGRVIFGPEKPMKAVTFACSGRLGGRHPAVMLRGVVRPARGGANLEMCALNLSLDFFV